MHGRPPTRLLIAVLLSAALGHAGAQPAPPPAPDAAEQAYREGRRHYDLHEWDDAIAQFKIAYRLRSDAASLFNIAQAYRLKGDCVEAQSFYKTYRRNFPTASNLGKVDRFIAELDACVKQRLAAPQPAPPLPSSSPATPPPSPDGTVPVIDGMPGAAAPGRTATDPRPAAGSSLVVADTPDPGRRTRTTGLWLAGTGAVVVGAGVVFAMRAASKSSDVSSGSGVWDPALETDGKRDQAIAIGLFVGGGAAIAVGGVMYYLGLRQSGGVAVTPRAGGASVAWSCAF